MTHYPRVSQTFVAHEVQGLRALGFEIVTFALNEPEGDEGTFGPSRGERDATVYVKRGGLRAVARAAWRCGGRRPIAFAAFVLRSMRTTGFDLRAMLWRVFHIGEATVVLDTCRRRGITHLHAQFGQSTATVASLTCELAALFGGPPATWSFTVHGFQEFVNETTAQLDRKASSASFVACVTDYQRSQLMRVTPSATWDRFHVVRVGIDFDEFPHRPRAVLEDPPVILVVGRLAPEKGQTIVIDALAQLREMGVRARVDFVGGGADHQRELEARAERRGVADAVRFLGELLPSDVAAHLDAADIFCLPSFAEGLPVSIMEAMAVGRPVVTTAVWGIPELAVDGDTALVVPASNVPALAEALWRVIEDASLRARLVTRALHRVHAQHDLARTTAQMAALFAAVARGDRIVTEPAPLPVPDIVEADA